MSGELVSVCTIVRSDDVGRRVNWRLHDRDNVFKAFELAVDRVGQDRDAVVIWNAYIQFVHRVNVRIFSLLLVRGAHRVCLFAEGDNVWRRGGGYSAPRSVSEGHPGADDWCQRGLERVRGIRNQEQCTTFLSMLIWSVC